MPQAPAHPYGLLSDEEREVIRADPTASALFDTARGFLESHELPVQGTADLWRLQREAFQAGAQRTTAQSAAVDDLILAGMRAAYPVLIFVNPSFIPGTEVT